MPLGSRAFSQFFSAQYLLLLLAKSLNFPTYLALPQPRMMMRMRMVGSGGGEDHTVRMLSPLPDLQPGALAEGLTSHLKQTVALKAWEGTVWAQRKLKAYSFLFTPGLRATALYSPKSLEIFGCSFSWVIVAIPLFRA